MSNGNYLRERRDSLEDEFFHKLQSEQLKTLREELERKQTREELQAATGISDEAVVDKLLELGMNGVAMAAMSLVPLVWVAWAEGDVDEKERKAVLEAAHDHGIAEDSAAHQILSGWLQTRPRKELFDAWAAYTRSLAETLVPAQRAQLREQVVGLARQVAESSGGFLGIGKVSSPEQTALAEVEAAFGDPA